MAAFTIFRHAVTGTCTAVYDFKLPTQTGVGSKDDWIPVYHGETSGLFDKAQQCKLFVAGCLPENTTPGGEDNPPARR